MTEFRFYAELGDFLPPAWRGRHFSQTVALHQSAKHAIEALGVPHTEVALLLINGQPASLTCRLGLEDRVRASMVPGIVMLVGITDSLTEATAQIPDPRWNQK